MADGNTTVLNVERTLAILDIFLASRSGLVVGEVARLTRYPKSTVYRVLLTMEARGYLQRGAGSDKFLLGERLLRIIGGNQEAQDLCRVAQPILDGLRDTCGETVGLHLLEGEERVCIAAAEGIRTQRTSGRIGSRAPLYSGASARCILAFLPRERWDKVVVTTGLAPITTATITDPCLLRQELDRIRAEGFAVSTGEWGEGITSLAAPVLHPEQGVVASINVSGPDYRFSQEKISMLAGALKAAAEVISKRLAARALASGLPGRPDS